MKFWLDFATISSKPSWIQNENTFLTYQSLGNIDTAPNTLVGWVVRDGLNPREVLWEFFQSLLVASPVM